MTQAFNLSQLANNVNTSGQISLASGVSSTLPITNGGTGQITQQAAINALAGAVTNSYVLKGNGTNVTMSALSATDIASGILPSANGGTNNGFTAFTGPSTSQKTFTLPDTNATLLYDGGALGTPASGTLSGCTVDGTNKVGYLTIPQNSQSATYTLVLADAGKHILHPASDTTTRTYTIPANGTVAYDIGTAINFVNMSANNVTIAIGGTDTLTLAGSGATGSRTLTQYGTATALKITSTSWIISGSNLS